MTTASELVSEPGGVTCNKLLVAFICVEVGVQKRAEVLISKCLIVFSCEKELIEVKKAIMKMRFFMGFRIYSYIN